MIELIFIAGLSLSVFYGSTVISLSVHDFINNNKYIAISSWFKSVIIYYSTVTIKLPLSILSLNWQGYRFGTDEDRRPYITTTPTACPRTQPCRRMRATYVRAHTCIHKQGTSTCVLEANTSSAAKRNAHRSNDAKAEPSRSSVRG